ncbi:hypothetical protein [Bradyrhizobium sp. CIR3A]|uniref:hypothetical protein n=1 Tax=Bradyrhizobium sp. CIR3A TaxID=2663838 RepID=UPI00160594AA|nr:hypothetical protein [Bradyrhizobium sp. CIR3A]MBB4263752.1 FtsZ-binding cell division protein ZapB [Bradyrhizobium sp. CIR3A]
MADSGLPLNDARTYAQDRLSSALKLDPAAALSDLESTRLKRTAAAEKVRGLEKDLDRIEIQIGEKTELIRKYTSLLPVDRNRLVREQNPICPLCEVPIDKVKAEGCGISTETCDLQALQSRIDRLTQDRAGLQMEVDRLKSSLSGHKFSHAQAKQDLDNLDLLVSRLEQALIDNSEGVRSAYRLVHDVDRATTLLNEKDDLERSIVSLREELTSSQDRLRAFREREAQVIARLSNRFDEVVGELVPGTVAGEVRLDGKTLHLSVQMGGVRRTAAISSLTVVAFDLACLCLAIEGNAKLPGFLLHDSPREADLGRSIYDRLFAFAKALEGYGEEPLFQYILTTTTSPPPEFREEPFCRLLLHGSPATERLFRTDL